MKGNCRPRAGGFEPVESIKRKRPREVLPTAHAHSRRKGKRKKTTAI